MQRLHEGLCLGDRYLLQERIATGGMGDVWRGRDEVLQRTVAVKILRPRDDPDADFLSRFRAEARHAAGLAHPNIAVVFDYGEHDSLAYLVMELVEGESLSALLKRRGRLDLATTRSVLSQAALAVAAAHDARVIHRDIKPANVMIGSNGQVKLTDFGIARALDAVGYTRTGEMIGTPHYLSPEQAMGKRATEAGDIYALGVIGYELVTGRRPFDKDTPVATLLSCTQDPLPPLPDDVPPALRAIIEQCLDKEPRRRPRSAREIAAALGVSEVPSHWSDLILPADLAELAELPAPMTDDATPTPTWSVPLAAPPDQLSWVAPREQSRDLEDLLANLEPRLHPGEFAIVSVTEPPEGVRPMMSLLEPEGVTLLVRVEEARALDLDFEIPLALITLGAYRAIGTQGFVPTLTTALFQARIASVAAAGRWHTHILVPAGRAEQAMKVLTRLSRAHRDED